MYGFYSTSSYYSTFQCLLQLQSIVFFQYHLTLFTDGPGLVLHWSLKILCGFIKRFASSFPQNISIYLLFNPIKAEINESKSEEIQLEIINNKGS